MTVADPSPETTETVAPEGDNSALPTTSNTDAPAASSTATETSDKPAGDKSAGEPAGDAPKFKSVHEATKAAMSKDKSAAPSAADVKTVEQPKTAADETTKTAEAERAEEIPAEFSKHPAWIRNAKTRDEAIKARDEFKVGAEKWNSFRELSSAHMGSIENAQAWMNRGGELVKAGVNAAEQKVVTDFAIAAKTDPNRAIEIIKPIYEALQGIVGEVLPNDLKEAVERGEMTEEAAKRLNKSEATARIERTRSAQAGKTAEERDAAEARTTLMGRQHNAVVSWEGRVSKIEPDWERIASLVNEQVGILREARQPKTPEEAVKICDDALAFVKRTAGVGAGPRPAVGGPTTVPSNRQQETRPKDVHEAVKRALAR